MTGRPQGVLDLRTGQGVGTGARFAAQEVAWIVIEKRLPDRRRALDRHPGVERQGEVIIGRRIEPRVRLDGQAAQVLDQVKGKRCAGVLGPPKGGLAHLEEGKYEQPGSKD